MTDLARAAVILLIVAVVTYLRIADAISATTVVAVLAGVMGFVVGSGLGNERRRPRGRDMADRGLARATSPSR